jgi:hypothetical protein
VVGGPRTIGAGPGETASAFRYPTASPHAGPSVRPERHGLASITTNPILIAHTLVQDLPRCRTFGSNHALSLMTQWY